MISLGVAIGAYMFCWVVAWVVIEAFLAIERSHRRIKKH